MSYFFSMCVSCSLFHHLIFAESLEETHARCCFFLEKSQTIRTLTEKSQFASTSWRNNWDIGFKIPKSLCKYPPTYSFCINVSKTTASLIWGVQGWLCPRSPLNNTKLIQYSQCPPVALMRRLHRQMKQMSRARSEELLAAHLPFITDAITKPNESWSVIFCHVDFTRLHCCLFIRQVVFTGLELMRFSLH